MMPRFALIIATLWLSLQFAAASPTYSELVRVPRHMWETDSQKRSDDATSVGLADHETFMWASTDAPNSKAVVVSMVAYSKQDERILDMDKFSFALASATCTEEDFSIKFKHPLIYQAAKIAWGWVNFNDLRSFVLVPSWQGCGKDKSHDPWVVAKVQFDDKTQKVIFDATKSTWKQVMNTFTLDFGEVVLGGNNHKRDIIPDLDEKFRLNLEATLPSQIFKWEIRKGVLNGTLTANCDECGTSGTLVFAGHVEASLGWDGVDVDKFEITVTPQGVQAHVGLSLEFEGELDFRQFVRPSQELTLLEIPVSGWNIPGIFEFGPRIQLNAGYVIDYIGGMASVSTGITARIPDSAIAKLDLLAEDKLEVSGWAPVIETDPLEIQAMIDAQARLYTEIALSVSLTVLDDNGFGVDLALKVPELTVTTAAGVNSNGFCDDGEDAWGVTIDASVGANLKLEGWKELDGDKDILFDATLFEKEDLYEFPQFCLSFGEISEGYCMGVEPLEEMTEEELEANDPQPAAASKRDTDQSLVARQAQSSRDPLILTCDQDEKYTFKVLQYNGPTALKSNVKVPIVKPLVPCNPRQRDCVPDTEIEVLEGESTKDQRAVVLDDETKGKRRWATEHIYEGNWIKDFLDWLHRTKFGNEAACNTYISQFFDTAINPPATVPIPPPARPPTTYIRSLLQQLGTRYTEDERAAVLPGIQNNHKFNMFADRELVSWFYRDKSVTGSGENREEIPNNHERRTCDLARIVTTCKYFDHVRIREGLKKTILEIEKVLAEMDKDSRVGKPDGFSFVDAHKEWFDEIYEDGIAHAREKLVEYATWMTGNKSDQWDDLSDDAQEQVLELAGGSPDWDRYCPSTARSGW